MDSAGEFSAPLEVLLSWIKPEIEPGSEVGRFAFKQDGDVVPAQAVEIDDQILVLESGWLKYQLAIRRHVDGDDAVLVVLQIIDARDVLEQALRRREFQFHFAGAALAGRLVRSEEVRKLTHIEIPRAFDSFHKSHATL